MYEFRLPDVGEGIHEGEILKWYVSEGDSIKEDSPLIDIETDKAAVTIPSPKSGKVTRLTGKIGDVIQTGTVIAVIDDGEPDVKPAEPPTKAQAVEVKQPPVITPSELSRPVPAAPATRRLAREMGINIQLVTPTGPGGRVTPEDVKKYADFLKAPKPSKAKKVEPAKIEPTEKLAQAEFAAHASSAIPFLDIEELPDFSEFGEIEKEKLRSIRRKVAHKMVTSMILIPHVSHMDEADVTDLEEFRIQQRDRRKGGPGQHLTLLPFVVKAVVAGLRHAKAFNASLDPFSEEIIYKKYYNIGIAVDTPNGLIVPVVKDANLKSIVQISDEIYDLAMRARVGKIDVSELKGGTFTITNIGPLGGTALMPAINYPEVAILAMGKAQDKPVVRDGQIVIRKMLPLTMAFDHRIADGADAARFVTEMTRELSDPSLLLLET
jgi:pyruvate dehydrogenase E2 component (dihydrolipoamide acetyltransferase)